MSRASRRKFNLEKEIRLPVGVSNEILENIIRIRGRVFAYRLSWPADKDIAWFMAQSFPAAVLEACRAGYQNCARPHRYGSETYTIGVYNTNVNVEYRHCHPLQMLSPHQDHHLPSVPADLHDFLTAAADIIYQFAKVEHVFRWFNLRASPAAMRGYCPWLSSLTSYDFPVSHTYQQPNDLGEILQLTRETAVIVANALMIPDKDRGGDKAGWSVSFTEGRKGGIGLPYVVLDM